MKAAAMKPVRLYCPYILIAAVQSLQRVGLAQVGSCFGRRWPAGRDAAAPCRSACCQKFSRCGEVRNNFSSSEFVKNLSDGHAICFCPEPLVTDRAWSKMLAAPVAPQDAVAATGWALQRLAQSPEPLRAELWLRRLEAGTAQSAEIFAFPKH